MKKLLYITLFGILFTGCKENQKKEAVSEVEETAMEMEMTSPELKIAPIEHATAVLHWGETTIYIDPVGGAEAFEGQKKPDLILITDIHGDHFSLETLDALDTSKAKIIVPQAVADKMLEKFTPQIVVLANGDSKEFSGIKIEALSMYNLRKEALDFHTKGRGNGYVLTFGDERVYFSGDTEDIPEMRALKNIDKAFICMNLPYTMTEESAASAVLEFKPKQVYPYHYRGNPDVSDVSKFKKLVNDSNPDIEVIQLDWYPKMDY
tara:strand:+ start:120378 stop:121169 length:792 start_codon:yes stop_codon:yes gene_type:complete